MKGMKIASNNPVLLLCLIILVILLLFLSLSLCPFLSTYELIVVKKSSRVAVVFFMFNAIVITIFRGSLKPSEGDCDCFLSFPSLACELDDDTKYENYDDSDDEEGDEYHGYDGYDEENDDDGGSDDDVNSEDEQVEDLERRVEDFIAKVNRQWREEVIYERLLCMAPTINEL